MRVWLDLVGMSHEVRLFRSVGKGRRRRNPPINLERVLKLPPHIHIITFTLMQGGIIFRRSSCFQNYMLWGPRSLRSESKSSPLWWWQTFEIIIPTEAGCHCRQSHLESVLVRSVQDVHGMCCHLQGPEAVLEHDLGYPLRLEHWTDRLNSERRPGMRGSEVVSWTRRTGAWRPRAYSHTFPLGFAK
jgi:hypothetical protein